jgi:hypothetical protein
MTINMILVYFISNYLIYSEFIRIYTNKFLIYLKICTLLHTAALLDSRSLPHCRTLPRTAAHTAAHCRTHCRTLPDSRALAQLMMMMMIKGPFGQLGLWAHSPLGVRDVFSAIAYACTYPLH